MVEQTATDDLVFADEADARDTAVQMADSTSAQPRKAPWKVMVVDDAQSIHDVTRLALKGFTFADRPLEFISCYSGAEAKQAILEHPDTAVMLLDVVMEDDHAGLEVANFVRNEAANQSVRIVLRTGQPGQAPEAKVITEYDINDYKEKTELTASKLFTLMYSSLRSYRDIMTIEASRRGLEQVINASANIFELKSLDQFAGGVLEQMTALLNLDPGGVYIRGGGLAASCNKDNCKVIAGSGKFEGSEGCDARDVLDRDKLNWLESVRANQAHMFDKDSFLGHFHTRVGEENFIYISGIEETGQVDKSLIELFSRNVAIAFENVHLHEDLEATQREIVYMLGEAVETRSKETGNHVKRVAEISKLLALGYGLEPEEAEIIQFASPLHDLGKIGIPDSILNKPGAHTDEEREIMKTHATIGYEMLKRSKRRVLRAGATIAHEHHERWDGQGYPQKKGGEDIHIYGRITAVADVFDALGSDRTYKKAWPHDMVVEFMAAQAGKQFDPDLIDILIANIDIVRDIQERFLDRVVQAAE